MSIIPGWPLHPIETRIRALRLNKHTDEWEACDYIDLHPGDIFKPVSPEGVDIDPFTFEPLNENVCIARGEPEPQTEVGSGYQLDVLLVGSLEKAD